MELLLAVLLWVGIITQEQTPYITNAEATELFHINADEIESQYPDEYGIIMIDENEVN